MNNACFLEAFHDDCSPLKNYSWHILNSVHTWKWVLDMVLDFQGLFRVSGNNSRIRRLKAAFDAHQINNDSLEIAEYINDPHSVCSVLKCYLRELPEPLMTHALHSEWVIIAK